MVAGLPTLTEARAALATALGAVDFVPEVIDPPCNVIEPGDPYLSTDTVENFAHDTFIVTVSVYVLVPDDDNEAMATQLNTGLLDALDAIENAEWVTTRVGQPDQYVTAGWTSYGVRITAQTAVSRT